MHVILTLKSCRGVLIVEYMNLMLWALFWTRAFMNFAELCGAGKAVVDGSSTDWLLQHPLYHISDDGRKESRGGVWISFFFQFLGYPNLENPISLSFLQV